MTNLDTKPEYLNQPVIVSPITEYSMEYPFGKGAIVWLRSHKAFYRIMVVETVNNKMELIPIRVLLNHIQMLGKI